MTVHELHTMIKKQLADMDVVEFTDLLQELQAIAPLKKIVLNRKYARAIKQGRALSINEFRYIDVDLADAWKAKHRRCNGQK